MDFSGIAGVLAFAVGVVLLLPLIVGGVFVILIVANRADPDPAGRRPAAVYTHAVSFITLFVTLFATFVIVERLCSLIGSHDSGGSFVGISSTDPLGSTSAFPSGGSQHPIGDAVARGVVLALILALVAGVVYVLHRRAADEATRGLALTEPAARVRSSYLSAVSFVCVMIVVITTVAATYQVFRILGPGVFNSDGSGSRVAAFRTLLPLLYLAGAAYALLVMHARQLPPGARPVFPGPRPMAGAPDTVADEVTEVAVVEVDVVDVAPPPRTTRRPRRPPQE